MKKKLFISLLLLTTFSCSISKKLQQGEVLLVHNKINIEQSDQEREDDKVEKKDIELYIPLSQTPNTTLFGFNIQTRIYNLANPKKNTWWSRTMRKMGKPPVLYDSINNSKGLRNISKYLASRGYFNAEVTDTVIIKDQKATVDYNIKPNNPYKVAGLLYEIIDEGLSSYIYADSSSTLIHVGDVYNRKTLEDERFRITHNLQNNGFFTFAVDDITYLIDTITSPYKAYITMNIQKRLFDAKRSDHKQYMVGKVIVDANYDSVNSNDTIVAHDTTTYKGVYFVSHGNKSKFRIKPLSQSIDIGPGSLYNLTSTAQTSKSLYDLSYFRNANISYTRQDTIENSGFGVVDCNILLTPELRQGYKVDAEVSTNSNYTGVSLTLGYVNKNIFRGAEIFDISVTGSYDFISNQAMKDSWEFGASTSLTFPRLLSIINYTKNTDKYSNVGTQVAISFNSQRRPDYDRTISTVSYGYNWTKNNKTQYSFKPISISLVSVPRIDDDYLGTITNEYLKNTYKSQIIAGGTFSVLLKPQATPIDKFTININGEISGNLLDLAYMAASAHKATDADTGERYYEMFNLRFAQYARASVDMVYKHLFGESGAIVYRLYGGGGVAYGNSYSLPFERMFFAGGSSSMRGWQVRSLGPGATPIADYSTYPNQVGNIRLETNLEGRFSIYGKLKGAIFFDLGNIWSNGKGETVEAKKFKADTFYKQLAFNTGLGLRFDISYFVLRLDWGMQIYNPAYQGRDRWVKFLSLRNTALHFAIGYPF
ncbi:MAG: BamA/TamA family outer membrane protein [Rikenellaceae bacterium]